MNFYRVLYTVPVKRLAEAIHSKTLVEIVEGKWFENQKAKSVTFRETAEKYMVKYLRKRDPHTIRHLIQAFGEMTLDQITASHVEDYILGRAESLAKPATIYQEYAMGRKIFNIARKRWKWVSNNPFADVTFSELQTIDNARTRWLTADEELVLLANAAPVYLVDVITFALHTGC